MSKDMLLVEDLYDEALTAVNPTNVKQIYGHRFPEHYDIPWRSRVTNSYPVHYPSATSVAGLPQNVYPIKSSMGPRQIMTNTYEDASFGSVMDPLTTRYQNMPSNPNAAVLFKGGQQENFW